MRLSTLDLPALERPAKATSRPASSGVSARLGALRTNSAVGRVEDVTLCRLSCRDRGHEGRALHDGVRWALGAAGPWDCSQKPRVKDTGMGRFSRASTLAILRVPKRTARSLVAVIDPTMSASTRVKACAPFSEGTEHVVHSVLNAIPLSFLVSLALGLGRPWPAPRRPSKPVAMRPAVPDGGACVFACHGLDHERILPTYPNLGGQHYSYLLGRCVPSWGGDRYAPPDGLEQDNLPDETLKTHAALYADGGGCRRAARAGPISLLGKRSIVTVCSRACRPAARAIPLGPGQRSRGSASMVSGQNAGYVATSSKAYQRVGERRHRRKLCSAVRGRGLGLNDEEIAAVILERVQGLRSKPSIHSRPSKGRCAGRCGCSGGCWRAWLPTRVLSKRVRITTGYRSRRRRTR